MEENHLHGEKQEFGLVELIHDKFKKGNVMRKIRSNLKRKSLKESSFAMTSSNLKKLIREKKNHSKRDIRMTERMLSEKQDDYKLDDIRSVFCRYFEFHSNGNKSMEYEPYLSVEEALDEIDEIVSDWNCSSRDCRLIKKELNKYYDDEASPEDTIDQIGYIIDPWQKFMTFYENFQKFFENEP